jgi:hypothetical protein
MPHEVRRIESRCAMMIAGSEFGRNTYRTAFDFQGEVLMDGCPKNDILVRGDPDEAARIRLRLGVGPETKLLMYAPTYRDDRARLSQDAVLDLSRTLDHLEAATGARWRCLYRAHYLNTGLNVKQDDRLMDVTAWPEMAELLLIGVRPDYQNSGVNSLVFMDMFRKYNEAGVQWAETNAILESNLKNQGQFRDFDHECKKRRRSYIKKLEY